MGQSPNSTLTDRAACRCRAQLTGEPACTPNLLEPLPSIKWGRRGFSPKIPARLAYLRACLSEDARSQPDTHRWAIAVEAFMNNAG